MAFAQKDFWSAFSSRIAALNSQTAFPLPSKKPFTDSRMDVFSTYTESGVWNTGIKTMYNPNCWASGYPLQIICWSSSDFAYSSGRGVAITPRHVLTGEHGCVGDRGHTLIWCQPTGSASNSGNITRKVIGARYQIGNAGGNWGAPNTSNLTAFRMLYLDQDLPWNLVCPMIMPSDIATNFTSHLPCMYVDKYQQAVAAHLASDCKTNPVQIEPPGYSSTTFTQGYTNFAVAKNMFLPVEKGDSGSPVFMMYGSSELALMGFMTNGVEQSGPSLTNFYDVLVAECKILNCVYTSNYGDTASVQHYTPFFLGRGGAAYPRHADYCTANGYWRPIYTPPKRPAF